MFILFDWVGSTLQNGFVSIREHRQPTMANTWASRLVTANTRVGVDSRKRENRDGLRTRTGDNLSVEKITGLGYPTAQWGDMMTGMYSVHSNSTVTHAVHSDYALYKDMSDEPWKYGDDVIQWEELDNKLSGTPERTVYWQDREARHQADMARLEERYRAEKDALRKEFTMVAKEAAKVGMKRWVDNDIKRIVKRFKGSAMKIQSLVRGYQTRCKNPHLDCCMCLSHRISPVQTEVGYMCRGCAIMGPYEDLVENDPWNWYRC